MPATLGGYAEFRQLRSEGVHELGVFDVALHAHVDSASGYRSGRHCSCDIRFSGFEMGGGLERDWIAFESSSILSFRCLALDSAALGLPRNESFRLSA